MFQSNQDISVWFLFSIFFPQPVLTPPPPKKIAMQRQLCEMISYRTLLQEFCNVTAPAVRTANVCSPSSQTVCKEPITSPVPVPNLLTTSQPPLPHTVVVRIKWGMEKQAHCFSTTDRHLVNHCRKQDAGLGGPI